MTLRKRLLNVARAELKSAAKKAAGVFDRSADREDRVVDEEPEKARKRREERPKERAAKRPAHEPRETAQIRRYYANLELPIGAPVDEVKAAYRRLMRRYHPDLHQGDREKAEIATRLAQELRVAYEGLLAHLEPKGR